MGDFTFRLIFFVLLWPVLPLISLLMANEAKVKKNIILGVTLPYIGQHDARVQEIARRFKRAQWLWCGAGSAIFAAVMFLGGDEGVLILALVLLPAAVLLPYVFFARANKKLRALKSAEGWRTPYAGSVVVDMKAAAGEPGGRLKRALFIPPVAAALLPAVYGLIAGGAERTDALLFSLPMALVCLLCWALYPLIFRQRADVVDTDSDLNAALTRVRRYNWGKMLLGTEYLTAAFGVAFWLLRNDGLWMTLLTIAYMFALIAFCLSTEFAVRRAQERLTAAHRSDEYVDEDDLWLWGLFYNNPNDRHIFINDRTGSGMGVNVGRPAGRVIVVGTALLLVGMMVLGVCLSAGFDAPREAHIDDGVLYFRHFTEKYEIPLEDIASLELIDELPGAKRIAGTGLPNLVEGRFRVEGYENTRISLNPEEPPYIAVVTADMSRIFALGTPQETEEFYNELKEALS